MDFPRFYASIIPCLDELAKGKKPHICHIYSRVSISLRISEYCEQGGHMVKPQTIQLYQNQRIINKK